MFENLLRLARDNFYYLFAFAIVVMFFLVLSIILNKKKAIVPIVFFLTFLALFAVSIIWKAKLRGIVLMCFGFYVIITGVITFILALIAEINKQKLLLLLQASSSIDNAILLYLNKRGKIAFFTFDFLNTFETNQKKEFEKNVKTVRIDEKEMTYKEFTKFLACRKEDDYFVEFELICDEKKAFNLTKRKIVYNGNLIGYALTPKKEIPEEVKTSIVESVIEVPIDPIAIDEEEELEEDIVSSEDLSQKTRTIYNYSFTSRLHLNDKETDLLYNDLKNHLLSYEDVSSNIIWKQESFLYKRKMIAKFKLQGKTMRVFLALDPKKIDKKYNVQDNSTIKSNESTPSMIIVKTQQQLTYAKELVDLYMKENNVVKGTNYRNQDYTLKKINKAQLIEMDLIKVQKSM